MLDTVCDLHILCGKEDGWQGKEIIIIETEKQVRSHLTRKHKGLWELD